VLESTLFVSAASLGGMALAYAGFPILGPLLGGGAMFYQMGKTEEWGGKMIEFSKASLYENSIPANDRITGSFFFPAVKPAKLKIGYLKGEARHWIVLDVTQNDNAKSAHDNSAPVQVAKENAPKPSTTTTTLSLQEVQRRLVLLGYNPGTQDGKYGRLTAQALRQFQADHGLSVTGMPDAATMRVLSAM
jgi:hypothetical protein